MTDVKNLITANIDVWTSAIKKRNSQGRGSNKKIELTGVKKLRELILELAVRGKLVPQDVNDEPASVLLEKIVAEKEQLIADKKIKKQKPLPAITDEERPFELPSGWEWSRFPELASYSPGKTPSTKNAEYWGDCVNNDYPWVSIADMKHYQVVDKTVKRVTEKASKESFKKDLVKAGTIIMSFKLTVGKISILGIDAYHNEAIIAVTPFKGVSKDYLYRFLPSRALSGNTKKAIMGNTLNSESLALITIPLPPLTEQHRIVAKVDELMALCNQLEQQTEQSLTAHQTLVEELLNALFKSSDSTSATTADSASGHTAHFQESWARIADHFDILFTTEHSIEQLKQTILQLAVMGKIVPQNPADEPASVLLEKIAEEKEQLIADKKIKKQKPLSAITDEERPFELPSGWEWSRLPDIGELARGKSKHRPRNDPKLYAGGDIKLIQTGDVARSNGVIETHTALYNQNGLEQSRLWPKGTMCITIAANIADTGILGFDACFPDSVVGFSPYTESLNVRYFEYFIRTAKSNLEAFAPATAQKNINLEILGQLLVPLPPLNELNSVVNKIDKLMALCDQLKTQLADAQTTQLHLADAVVEQALN